MFPRADAAAERLAVDHDARAAAACLAVRARLAAGDHVADVGLLAAADPGLVAVQAGGGDADAEDALAPGERGHAGRARFWCVSRPGSFESKAGVMPVPARTLPPRPERA